MERVRLTNQRIERAACPPGKGQSFIWDTESPRLAVRITAAGAKSFIFEGKLNRETIRSTIGACSVWTLEDARKEANRLQGLVDQDIDPRELRRQHREEKKREKDAEEKAQQEAERNKKYTLKALCETYADYLESQGKKGSAASARSAMKRHIFEPHPDIARIPAREVTPLQVADTIRRVMEAGKERSAGILRSYLSAAFNCARKAPLDGKLPADFIGFGVESNPVDPVPTIPVKARHRTLSKDELKAYLAALGDTPVDMALRLALFSGGQRMAQLLRAEVADWDPETKTLRLLDSKGKRRDPREHLLPLASVAAGIVAALVERADKAGKRLLFASGRSRMHVRTPGKRALEISSAMNGDPFDLRDIRRTTETMLASLGISRDIRAQLLSHGISGVQAQHYDRHQYLEEKRAALRKWERHLKKIASIEEKGEVISFKNLGGNIRT